MQNNNPTFVVTGRVRLSFTHLFQPYSHQPGQEAKYSTTILLPKSDIATKQRIDAAVQAATELGVTKTWNGARPPMLAIPIYDGDGVRPNGDAFGDECKGHWVFTASSKQQPQVVDISLNPIINQSDVYSGMYARVSLNFFPYANSGKRGIGCGLNNVQKIEDGEPLGGRTNAADDFGGTAPQQGYPQQSQAQPTYQQQPQYGAPAQAPNYQQQQQIPQGQPVQQPQIDPITGAPIGGGVYGI